MKFLKYFIFIMGLTFIFSAVNDDALAKVKVKKKKVSGKGATDGQVIVATTNAKGKVKPKWTDLSVSSDQIVDGAITSSKIQSGAISLTSIDQTGLGLKAATVIVASDGTGDTTDVEEAIETLVASGGGSVIILEGNYTVDSEITLKSNLTIIGRGKVVLTNTTSNSSTFSGNSLNDVFISGLEFQGGGADNSLLNMVDCTNVCVDKCIFENGTGSTLVVFSAPTTDNITIQNCYFDNSDISNVNGINISMGGDNFKILNNTILNCQTAVSLIQLDDAIVQGNIVKSNLGLGIHMFSCENVIVSENIIRDNAGNGVNMTGTGEKQIVIANNCIKDNGGYGVQEQNVGAFNIMVNSNIIVGNTSGDTSFATGGQPESSIGNVT